MIDRSGSQFTNESESETKLCLTVAKETNTDFEKLYYKTPFSEVFRLYANICELSFVPLTPEEESLLKALLKAEERKNKRKENGSTINR